MKKNFKKSLSVILAVIMAVSCFSVVGFAAETVYPGHENHDIKTRPAVAASGCKDGKTEEVYCDACEGDPILKAAEVVDAPHNLGDWEIQGPVTDCEKTYTRTKTCKDCKKIIKVETKNLHDWELIDTDVAAKCTEISYENKKCKVCKKEVREPLPAGLHSWGEDAEAGWETVDRATCTLDGLQRRDCEKCIEFETRVIPKTGHKYKVIDAGSEPTCEKEGSTAKRACIYCNDTIAGVSLGKLGHKDLDGDNYCDNCEGYLAEGGEICPCPCHQKTGVLNTIFKIVLFFLRLFKTGQTCGCGAAHYEA